MEHGNLKVLIQPAETGHHRRAAVGTVLIANPLHLIKEIAGGIGGVFGGSKSGKQAYLERGATHPAGQRRPAGSGDPGARFRRSAAAQTRRVARPSNRRISLVQYVVNNHDHEDEKKESPDGQKVTKNPRRTGNNKTNKYSRSLALLPETIDPY